MHASDAITLDNDDSHIHGKKPPQEYWVCQGSITLYNKDRQYILCGKELNDLHVNTFQMLLKKQFKHAGGLQNTLMQRKSPLPVQDVHQTIYYRSLMYAIHTGQHQVTGSTVSLYDSAYNTISKDTFEVIAQLVRCKDTAITINVMNVARQAGWQ